MSKTEDAAAVHIGRRSAAQAVQISLAGISLATLGIGLGINWFGAEAGFSADVINAAAFGMMLTATAHATALWLWEPNL